MAINAFEHTKHLHAADHMFDSLPNTRQDTIVLALLGGQRRRVRCLVGGDGMPVSSPEDLIPCVPDQRRIVRQPQLRLTKQLEIVDCSSTRRRAQDALGDGTDQHLKLQGVPLFLAAVPATLFFSMTAKGA